MADEMDMNGKIDFDFFEDEREKKIKASIKSENVYENVRCNNYNDEIMTRNHKGVKDKSPRGISPNIINIEDKMLMEISSSKVNDDDYSSLSSSLSSASSKSLSSKNSRSDHELSSDSDCDSDANSNPNVSLSSSSFSDSESESKLSKKNSFAKLNLTDDDITDVSPLSSANISPIPAPSRLAKSKRAKDVQFHSSVQDNSPKDKVFPKNQSIDLKLLMQAIAEIEKQQKTSAKRVLFQKAVNNRKNHSFSNDEVRRIDHENQRLLKEIVNCQKSRKSTLPAVAPAPRLTHSAVNRQREHKRIEMENKALLKRIESAKPSKETCRAEQLKDYARLQQNFTTYRPKHEYLKKRSGPVSLRSHSAASMYTNSLSAKSDSGLRTKSANSSEIKRTWEPGW